MKYLIPLLILAGCASPTIPNSYGDMSAEQMRALASDKNATITCAMATSMLNKVVVVYVMLDKSAIIGGSVSVSGEDCTAKIVAVPK